MRFILLQDHVEYWSFTGKVIKYPMNTHTVKTIRHLAKVYHLLPQRFNDRIIYTEFIV